MAELIPVNGDPFKSSSAGATLVPVDGDPFSAKPAKKSATKAETSIMDDIKQGAGNIVAGAVRGAGSIGATLLTPVDAAARALGVQNDYIGRTDRRQAMDEGLRSLGADTDSLAFKGGKLGAEVAGTAGVGGALANGVRVVAPAAIAASPRLAQLLSAIETGGFSTGAPAATNALSRLADLGVRITGGAVTGGASAGLVNPDDAGGGAVIGAAMPPVIKGVGAAGDYVAKAAGSIVKPFTQVGQTEIAGKVLRKFAEGGPTAVSGAEIVPGSAPTLAEATGNAGLATLQRGVRDIRPNAFIEREANNAAARRAMFDDVAGDSGKLDFFKADRSAAAEQLYGEALDPANQNQLTPWLKGQITQLLKRPSIDEASRTAQRWAIERGEKPYPSGSLTALHDVKMAIDDKIAEAARKGAGGEVKALEATKQKLLSVMEKLSDKYGEARVTYAQMSEPINAMETLQGLKLTDAQGGITLAKVQNAIKSLEQHMKAPGANAAKSVSANQMAALTAIRDDLLRQSNLGLGRSIGSNTFQNIATDNILQSIGGNTLSRLADKAGISGVVGQVGRLAYSGPNEAIRNRLVDMMLQPQMAEPFITGTAQLGGPNALARLLSDQRVQQPLYRVGPLLVTDR